MCFKFIDPSGSGELPGFMKGYLIGCAVVAGLLVIELIILL